MALPQFLQFYLPSYDIKMLTKDHPATRKEIITQVLNIGDDKAVRWLFRNYPLEAIKDSLYTPKRGTWFEKSLNYWSRILKIDISSSDYERAILDLNKFADAPRNSKSKSG